MADLKIDYVVHVENGKFDVAQATVAFTGQGGDQYRDWPYLPAPYHYKFKGGAGSVPLFSYTCEGQDEVPLTTPEQLSQLIGLGEVSGLDPADANALLQNDALIFPVPIPADCGAVRLYYNMEGGALLFVSARHVEGDKVIGPKSVGPATNGSDASFPVKEILINDGLPDASTLSPDVFGWSAGADATGAPNAHPGTWSTTALPPGDMTFTAKPQIVDPATGKTLFFHHWAYRTRSASFAEPEIDEDDVFYLPSSQVFAYLIAYYGAKSIGWGDWDEPIHNPGEIDYGRPARWLALTVIDAVFDLFHLKRGRVRPTRRAGGGAARPADAATRRRVVELAERYPDGAEELERLLHDLNR